MRKKGQIRNRKLAKTAIPFILCGSLLMGQAVLVRAADTVESAAVQSEDTVSAAIHFPENLPMIEAEKDYNLQFTAFYDCGKLTEQAQLALVLPTYLTLDASKLAKDTVISEKQEEDAVHSYSLRLPAISGESGSVISLPLKADVSSAGKTADMRIRITLPNGTDTPSCLTEAELSIPVLATQKSDSSNIDSASKESEGKEAESKVAESKEAESKEAESKEAESKEAASKEDTSKDAASKDAASKDAASKDLVQKDSEGKDSTDQDSAKKSADSGTTTLGYSEGSGYSTDAVYSDGGSYSYSSGYTGTSTSADPQTPRVMVTKYDYDHSAKQGDPVEVALTLKNTSKSLAVENMQIMIDGGEHVSLEEDSNAIYISKLKAEEEQTIKLKLKVLPSAAAAASDITLTGKYEYLKSGTRTELEVSQKIPITLSAQDRLTVSGIKTDSSISTGEEFSISLPFVNKGSAEIRNMEASIKTDLETADAYKYIGTVGASTQGSADFFVKTAKSGDHKVTIKLTYEDSRGTEHSAEKTTTVSVPEKEYSANTEEIAEEDLTAKNTAAPSVAVKIASVSAIGVLAAAAALLLRKRKMKKHSDESNDLF